MHACSMYYDGHIKVSEKFRGQAQVQVQHFQAIINPWSNDRSLTLKEPINSKSKLLFSGSACHWRDKVRTRVWNGLHRNQPGQCVEVCEESTFSFFSNEINTN